MICFHAYMNYISGLPILYVDTWSLKVQSIACSQQEE